VRVSFTIHAGPGQWFDPDDFAPMIGRELERQPGAVRAWLVAAEVSADGHSVDLTADLVEPSVGLEEDTQHGQDL
jgi:hypothetical protein